MYTGVCFARELHHFRHDLVEEPAIKEQLAYSLPLALLDTAFVLAVFRALHNSRKHLQAKGSSFRLNVYRCFTACVATVVAICCGYLAFEVHFQATHPPFEKWRFEWVRSSPPLRTSDGTSLSDEMALSAVLRLSVQPG